MTGFYWLASYPESGNSWLRTALQCIHPGGVPIDMASARETFDAVLDVESSDLTMAEIELLRPKLYETMARQTNSPMIRNVHDAWKKTATGKPLFPATVTLGAVYLVRDPRDVALSYANESGCSIDEAIAFLADPDSALADSTQTLTTELRQHLLTWSLHVESWLDAPGIRLLPMRYEEIAADPNEALGRIAAFLGWRPERQRLAAAAARIQPFFIDGNWRDALTPDQVRRIETDHGDVMQRLAYQ